jgi:hypothetical protein
MPLSSVQRRGRNGGNISRRNFVTCIENYATPIPRRSKLKMNYNIIIHYWKTPIHLKIYRLDKVKLQNTLNIRIYVNVKN